VRVIIADDSQGQTAHYFIRLGWARAFEGAGHEAFLWDTNKIPIIDIFDNTKPDLFIGQTYNINRGWIKAIEDNPQCKVVLTGSDWSQFSDNIDINKYPIVRANQKEIKLVEELIKRTGKPDLIMCHYHNNNIGTTHEFWRDKLGVKIGGIPPAADIIDYTNGKYMSEFESDITFIGGKWGYKSLAIDKWFLPLCDYSLNLNIKIFGNKSWGIPQYCGFLPNEYARNAFKSAKVCPNISEPHAQDFGIELNERCFKLLSNKCAVVSDYTSSLAEDIFNDGEIEFANTPKEFKEKILSVIDGSLKIDTQRGYDKVMESHTYFARIQTLFEMLHMQEEADNVKKSYQQIREVNVL